MADGAKFKITMSRSSQKLLGLKATGGKFVQDDSELLPEVRKEFRRIGPKSIRLTLLSQVRKGISPVDGEGRFPTYSESYRKEIGKGKSRRMRTAKPKKRKSPVTLNLSGELHNSLKLFTSGGFGETFKLVFNWDNFLADVHNRLGASKKKVKRRILPTKSGEKFNESITKDILDRLNDSAKLVIRRFFR